MVVLTMDPTEKERVLNLIKVKDKIETEIAQYGTVLQNNRVGMSDPLVDADGFPRNDIDVYQVRQARHRIICLQNDYKKVMKDIECGLHSIHEPLVNGSKEPVDNITQSQSSGNEQILQRSSVNTRPFVKVNLVVPSSPAEQAGLIVGDTITEFGSVNANNFTSLQQIGQVVNNSIGKNVTVMVIRSGETIKLNLIPKQWSGRGLLGCNIVQLDEDMDFEK